jgi:hypothetical protein
MDTFKIRSYSKKELALMYFPDSTPRVAVNHLRALIRRNDMLWDELQKTGYKNTSKVFTPRQVEAIVDWIGAP